MLQRIIDTQDEQVGAWRWTNYASDGGGFWSVCANKNLIMEMTENTSSNHIKARIFIFL